MNADAVMFQLQQHACIILRTMLAGEFKQLRALFLGQEYADYYGRPASELGEDGIAGYHDGCQYAYAVDE